MREEWERPIRLHQPIKMHDRPRSIETAHNLIDRFIPEYKQGGKRILDISCGNGVFLEIMREYGHGIMGTEVTHFTYLDSQNIPYIPHQGHERLPFEDKSYDLVTCIGAITFFDIDWNDFLSDVFRVARECVLITANKGIILDHNQHKLDHWRPEGWHFVEPYKWVV